jgi:hypothetical protein
MGFVRSGLLAGTAFLLTAGIMGCGGGSGSDASNIRFRHADAELSHNLGHDIGQRGNFPADTFRVFSDAASWEAYLAEYGYTPDQFPDVDFATEQVGVALTYLGCSTFTVERIRRVSETQKVTVTGISRSTIPEGGGCAGMVYPTADVVIFPKQSGEFTFEHLAAR